MRLQNTDFVHVDPVTDEVETIHDILAEFAVMVVGLVVFVSAVFWAAGK